jgi:hypothetical protein
MRDLPVFLSGIKARHDKMVGLVVTMRMTADGLRLAAYGPDEDEMRIPKDLPKAKTPHEQESLQRQIAATDKTIDALVYELYGLTEEEVRIVEGGLAASALTETR